MPTYSYHCKKCDSTVEHFHGINANPRIKCEDCNTVSKRMIGKGAGIIFKGSGFYETDYKTKTGMPEKKEASKKESSKEKSSDSKKDTKTKTASPK